MILHFTQLLMCWSAVEGTPLPEFGICGARWKLLHSLWSLVCPIQVNIHTLAGHTNTVSSVLCQATDPQIITASNDSTVRLWDLAAGKSVATLTNHKKSVRGLVSHPKLLMFASGGPDNIKQWRCPDGKFIQVEGF